jgi:truncated hemoglobin YjbI
MLQVKFMAYAFGASKEYTGLDLAKAHAHLIKHKGLGLDHFDLVAGHFVAALTELGVEEGLVQEAAAVVLSTRPIFDPAQYLDKKAEAAAPAGTACPAAAAVEGAAGSDAEEPTLAARLGGEAALVAAVDLFYEKLVADPELARFFEKIPIKLLKQKQVRRWACQACGAAGLDDACNQSFFDSRVTSHARCWQSLQWINGYGSLRAGAHSPRMIGPAVSQCTVVMHQRHLSLRLRQRWPTLALPPAGESVGRVKHAR